MSSLSESVAELRDNPGQWRAFQTEGHCVVLAPPGSGKTKLLATRAAYDLATCIPRPHGAACITLTNPAADELRRRIAALGTDRRSTFSIGTVHSFALTRIILPFAHPAGMAEITELKIASQAVREAALRDSVDELLLRATIDCARPLCESAGRCPHLRRPSALTRRPLNGGSPRAAYRTGALRSQRLPA